MSIARTFPSLAMSRTPSARLQSPSLLRPPQVIEKFLRTEEYSCVDGVVGREIFPDRHDPIGLGLHFHRVIQVEDRFDFSIDRQI